MKTYSFDYTKVYKAEVSLCAAQEALRKEDEELAKKSVNAARELLQQFLNGDNLVRDNDVEDGFVKSRDCFDDEQVVFIRDLFGDQLSKWPYSTIAEEELEIINKCQDWFGDPRYEDVTEFMNDESNNWGEKHVPREGCCDTATDGTGED